MPNLTIADGRKKFTINGDESRAFYVNLTDNGLAVRAKKARDFVHELKIDEHEDEIDFIDRANTEMRKQIDYVFGDGVSESVFGNIFLTAVVDDKTGKTFFEAFFDSIMPEVEKAQKIAEKSMKESEKRISKFTAKYVKK